MPDLPTGIVTFLFTDIEGSTRLLQELGTERYGLALEEHRRIIRDAFGRHTGQEVDTQGDAFFVAFSRPQDAVRAAAESQRALVEHSWPAGHELRVRMGIHTGEATATDTGYVGVGVHRGARICAAGYGGQVLVSHTTRVLIEDAAIDVGFRDLGEHRLKDLSEPHRLYQLLDPQLPQEFPPVRTLENRPTNLPTQATPLIGREREVDEITELLRSDGVRLVTLTGPGGTGKTRLALQAAAELVEEFPNGVYFIALAAITDPALVMPAVAQTVGVNEAAGQSFLAYLATKKMLLVADNLEQVIAAASSFAELLGGAPGVKLLATSREALRVSAERVYPVPPLQLPDAQQLPEVSVLSQYESVALFAERARAVQPNFEVTTQNAPAVAEICVRLDGLPLAIELAAARIPLLSPEAMLNRLGQRLKLLRGGSRDLPARQQTLRDALAWSYDLLDGEERRLFSQLGVFSGGFTLEAAEQICDADLDTLASLVAKSLVRRDGERLTMLETIREYALERLAASGEEEKVRGDHAAYFEELAERAYLERVEKEGEWSEELEREHDNLRSALDWLGRTDPKRRLRLAGALGWFWHFRSHLAEGLERIVEALDIPTSDDGHRARAQAAAAELAGWQGKVAEAQAFADEAMSIWQELGARKDVALLLCELGWGYFITGDDPTARRCMEQSLDLMQSLDNPFLVNRARCGLMQVLVSMGEIETVETLGPETLELARRLGDLRSEHYANHFLADGPLIRGDCETAEMRYHRSLELAVELADRVEIAAEIQGVAMAAAGKGRAERALRLGSAAQAELDALGIDFSGIRFWQELLERYLGMARAQVGAAEADAIWEEGRRMGFERATEEALALEMAATQ